jgi:hypothetical protein
MTDLVQCSRAGALDDCKTCDHAVPHGRETFGGRWQGGPEFCTEWRECWRPTSQPEDIGGVCKRAWGPVFKVRCVRVKP